MRFVFVRDGFYFWAFLLSPLWMLRYRLWLVLIGYLIVAAALQAGAHLLGASASVKTRSAITSLVLRNRIASARSR